MTQANTFLEIIPDHLSIEVIFHDVHSPLGNIPCRTLVTRGMKALDQNELLFSTKLGRSESKDKLPEEQIAFLKQMYDAAANGTSIMPGLALNFGAPGFMGTQFRAAIFVPCLQAGEFAQDAHAVILLTEDEFSAYESYGAARVLALMGNASRVYPYPICNDRARSSLVSKSTLAQMATVLGRVRAISLAAGHGAHAVATAQALTLTICRPHFAAVINDAMSRLAADEVVSIQTSVHPDADCCFVWSENSGGRPPLAIGPTGTTTSRKSGAFILIGHAEAPFNIGVIEDGFSLFIPEKDWPAVKRALCNGEDFSLTAPSGVAFNIEWSKIS